MRRTLLWASTNPWLSERLPRYGFVRRAVRRFMPGEELEDAIAESRALASRGVPSVLTLLGENVTTREETDAVVAEYRRAIDEARRLDLDALVSVKPTHLGLDIDPGLALDNLAGLADHAAPELVWIDMESSRYVDPTLELFRELRRERDNLGVCLQAYLRRTPDDLDSLLPLDPAIRLVKGAYAEPSEIAFTRIEDVDAAYDRLAARLLGRLAERSGDGGRGGFVALGTHDRRRVEAARARAEAVGAPADAWEVEMLYGVAKRLQEDLVAAGVPLRILISYGDAWFPWYMRRLAERPANVWFVVRSLFR